MIFYNHENSNLIFYSTIVPNLLLLNQIFFIFLINDLYDEMEKKCYNTINYYDLCSK